MTYDELFQLKGLEKIKLWTGKSVLMREITGAHVVEFVEAQDWVKPGELIFLSGIAYHDVYEDLKKAIQSLSMREVAGIVVEIGPYIPDLPREIIDFANSMDVVLLSLPFEVPVSAIISQIYFDLYNKEELHKSVEKFMTELLYGDSQTALERIELFPFNSSFKYLPLFIGGSVHIDADAKKAAMSQLLQAIKMTHPAQNQLLYLMEEDGIALLLELPKGMDRKSHVKKFQQSLQQKIQSRSKNFILQIGIGNTLSDASEIRKNIFQAQKAYKILCICPNKDCRQYYDEIGIYRIFLQLKDHEVLEHLYEENLGKLISYDAKNEGDLIHTLDVYLESGCSITQTTDLLYVHRNTVKYRIKRIQEVLGYDLHSPTVQFNLRLAYQIKHYLGW